MILNSIVDMHPNGIQLKYITAENISFVKTKFIINFYGNKIMINDNFNKVITLYGTTKDDINITTNKNCWLIRIINKRVELKTEKRILEILNDNKINGMGKQLFGITKHNVQNIIVDKKGYFIEVE